LPFSPKTDRFFGGLSYPPPEPPLFSLRTAIHGKRFS